jgi:effector-binding domain-containing protein
MSYRCRVRSLKPQPIVSIRGRTTLAALPETIGEFLREVWGYVAQQGGRFAGPPFTRYHAMRGDEIDLEAGLPVATPLPGRARIGAGELPGGEGVATLHIGPYEGLPGAGKALDEWARRNGRDAAGPHWEVYLTDPGAVTDPARWETEVIKPLKPRSEES